MVGSAGDAFDGSESEAIETILNSGTISGGVLLSSSADDVFNSTLGTVTGTIIAGSGGDTIIAGQSGGAVNGGLGNDVLYANPTQTAVNTRCRRRSTAVSGKNALYGDGPIQPPLRRYERRL